MQCCKNTVSLWFNTTQIQMNRFLRAFFGILFFLMTCKGEASFAQIDTFFVARSTGAMAYLNYGLGTDRLGGAKMGYIDSLVLLKITARHNDLYRVRLAPNLSAWIPQNMVRPDTTTKMQVQNLTGSWRVWGDDRSDYLSVGLPERLPYRSWQEVSPSKVCIEIFGATANTNWITQLKSAREIKNVDYQQVSDDIFRITIQLKHPQHWGYQVNYVGKRLTVRVSRQPKSLKIRGLTVALDPGHGGTNLGAVGRNSGVFEKDLNLSIVLLLQKELERKGATVRLTRNKDTLIGNNDRVLKMRQQSPDVLISIHNNAAADSTVGGTSTYYKHLGFRSLSEKILRRLLQLDLKEYGNVGSFNFAFNGPTEYPNVLVEGAFMSNAEEEKQLLDARFQKAMAKKIARGLKDWLKSIPK